MKGTPKVWCTAPLDYLRTVGLADAQKKVKFGYFLGTFWVTEKGGGGVSKLIFLGGKIRPPRIVIFFPHCTFWTPRGS